MAGPCFRTDASRSGRIGLLVLALAGAAARPAEAQTAGFPPPAVRGNVDAVLEVVVFSDFQCPFCALAVPVLDSLFARHGDEVRLVYRHYPLPIHEHARRAAEAAVEAGRQDAFWEYHDLLFANQDRQTAADLVEYADSLDLEVEAFAEALGSGAHAAAVEADVALGMALAVTGTPTFFIGGYRVVGVPPLWVFEEALEAFREGRVRPRPLEPLRGKRGKTD